MQEAQLAQGNVIMDPSHLNQLFQEIDTHKEAEAKLQCAITFMENAVAEQKEPDFKLFWEMRKKCLELFKENMPPFIRSQLWVKFSDLSKEARRLKHLLDEQSDFAAEQIGIAIQGIEKELADLPQLLSTQPNFLPERVRSLDQHFDFYNATQSELNLLNLFATRVTALRKELIKTEMRIRTKNQFFERLSKAGDLVFPRRKNLIQEISQAFEEDVNKFVHEQSGATNKPIFAIREEVKTLQNIAKMLTLNTHAFGATRMKLSALWDQLKEKDKERKIELDKKREIFKQHADELSVSIASIDAKFDMGELSLTEALQQHDQLVTTMRSKELGREDVQNLREALTKFRAKVHEKQRKQEQERHQQEEIRLKQKQELLENLQAKLNQFLTSANEKNIETILSEQEALVQEINASTLNKQEKMTLEKLLKPIKEIIRDKKEAELLNLPTDDRQALLQLKELLKQKQEQREEIKIKLELYRKQAGSSGLNFEKAMEYNAQVAEEKASLEKIQSAIKEIENKIKAF